MKKLIVLALFGATLALSTAASAATGYVGAVRRLPASTSSSGTTGAYGEVMVMYYSAPRGTGTFLGTRYYCSPNATHFMCASSSSYHYNREDLDALAQMFLTAAQAGTKIGYFDATCNGSSSLADCGGGVYFYGAP